MVWLYSGILLSLKHGDPNICCNMDFEDNIYSVKWLLILNDFICMIYGEWQVLGTGEGEEESLSSGDRISVWKMGKAGDGCEWSHARSFTLNVVKVQHKPHVSHW